jgi:hypothetical protein
MYLLSFHFCITFGDFTPFFLRYWLFEYHWWWRFLFALPLLPNLFQLSMLLFYFKLDTPFYYYINATQPDKAIEVLRKIYKPELVQALMNYDMQEERYSMIVDAGLCEIFLMESPRKFLINSLIVV